LRSYREVSRFASFIFTELYAFHPVHMEAQDYFSYFPPDLFQNFISRSFFINKIYS
jgi:hypothetical protein